MSDTGKQGTPVDLGKDLGEPRDFDFIGTADTGNAGRDAGSTSPLSDSRGGADPTNIGPGAVQTGFKG